MFPPYHPVDWPPTDEGKLIDGFTGHVKRNG